MARFYALKLLGVLSLFLSCAAWAAKDKAAPLTQAEAACTAAETWAFSAAIPEDWSHEIESSLEGKISSVLSYSESMALQKDAKDKETQILGIYWKNRSLFRAGLIHMSSSGFNWLASEPVSAKTIGIQFAALACLNEIHYQYPRIYMAKTVEANLSNLARGLEMAHVSKAQRTVFLETIGILIRAQLAEKRPMQEIKETLRFLKDGGAHEQLARGLISVQEENFDDAIKWFSALVANKSRPKAVDRYMDSARLSLARVYYKKQNFKDAEAQLSKVAKDSNEIVNVLTELVWVYYMQKKYGESVGTAMNLQTGSLKFTFGPEGVMVMAMALNELCQYPSSLRAIRFLKNQYREGYAWLKDWYKRKSEGKGDSENLYPQIVSFLESGKTKTPRPVMSEWVRSPVFISHQQEINLFLDEEEADKKFKKEQVKEFETLKTQIKDLTEQVNTAVAETRRGLAPGESLPSNIRDAMKLLETEKARFARLKDTILSYRKVSSLFKEQARILSQTLIDRINAELAFRNVGMLRRLKYSAENSYLVEVEIYTGASDDVLWKSAHPDYKDYTKKVHDRAKAEEAEKVWNWGKAVHSEDGVEEVWADELGNLKADITDNCGNRDRYLDVKFDVDVMGR